MAGWEGVFDFAKDPVHGDVMGFREGGFDLWASEADADFESIRAGVGQQAIVESLAAPQPAALWVEAQARAEKQVHLVRRDDRQGGVRLADAEGSGAKARRGVGDLVEDDFRALDAREDPAQVRVAGNQWQEIDLTGHGGEAGDRADGGAGAQPGIELRADGGGIGGGLAQACVQFAAQRVFGGCGG